MAAVAIGVMERRRVRVPPLPRHVARIAARTLAIVLAVWLTASFAGAYRTLHPPRRPLDTTPAQHGMAYRDVSFRTADGLTLRGWWIPGHRHATVVMIHGYGNNREEPLSKAGYLHHAGYNLLVFDLRGHGQSDGDGTTVGYREPLDARAAVAFARHVDGGPVVLFGYSLGGAVALEDASVDPAVEAVIEDSGFSSVADVFPARFTGVTGLPDVPFAAAAAAFGTLDAGPAVWGVRPIATAAALDRPLLVIVGGEDAIVPPEEGLAIYAAAHGPKELLDIPTAGHVDGYYSANRLYEKTVLDFLDRSLGS